MTTATLLVELLTEELPPKALRPLGEAFANGIAAGLKERGFLTGSSSVQSYATPRRLAVQITAVLRESPPHTIERKLMPVAVALDAQGKPTAALMKKLAGFGVESVQVEDMERRLDGKTLTLFFRQPVAGSPLRASLEGAVEEAIDDLPIPKLMSYQAGNDTVHFVRPAHRLVALHGTEVEPIEALGLIAYRMSSGHRFSSVGEIALEGADDYVELLKQGRVIASFDERRAAIEASLAKAADGDKVLGSDSLLDEVTALVEWPVVYRGEFDPAFLAMPRECLILSMRQHQRYFPLADQSGKLLPHFLMVSNLETEQPQQIIHGNERVLRARLADARFFYDQDRKTRLADRVPKLGAVVYHNKLGSQFDRVARIEKLARAITARLGADGALTERAAHLCKADLLTDMVGEFPELQGVMGRYYAAHDGEPKTVADAIEAHYRPRHAGDALPEGDVSICVALADKLEVLTGMFGVGQQPTGDKDPFGLRRQAIGVVRILVECELALTIIELVALAFAVFRQGLLRDSQADLTRFVMERLRTYLRERGYSANEVEAVLGRQPLRPEVIMRQLAAVRAFAGLPEAQSLAAANKRVANILKQAAAKGESFVAARSDKFAEPAEHALFEALRTTSREAAPLFEQGDFAGYLKTFAILKSPVDAFFDSVMVMTDDPALRQNRLGLLAELRREMNQVADLSKLAA